MSPTSDARLRNVQRLAQSLMDGNKLASELFSRAASLQTKLEGIKQFQGEANNLNQAASRTTVDPEKSDYLNRTWINDLQEENSDLRQMLEEVQGALDMIMAKHRSQVQSLLDGQRQIQEEAHAEAERQKARNRALENEVVHLTATVSKMAQVMCLAVDVDSNEMEHEFEEQVLAENESLREMLKISGHPVDQQDRADEEKLAAQMDY